MTASSRPQSLLHNAERVAECFGCRDKPLPASAGNQQGQVCGPDRKQEKVEDLVDRACNEELVGQVRQGRRVRAAQYQDPGCDWRADSDQVEPMKRARQETVLRVEPHRGLSRWLCSRYKGRHLGL